MNFITRHRKALAVAIVVGLYLRFGLPATAVLFYELYHLTNIGPIYWGYSAFKAAGYFFGTWPYQGAACIGVSALIIAIAAWRGNTGEPA